MIQKLKRKFIIVNVSFVMIVMIFVVGVLFFSEYQNEKRQIEHNLNMALENGGDFRPSIEKYGDEKKEDSFETEPMKLSPVFTAKVDDGGNIIQLEDSRVKIDNTIADWLVSQVWESGTKSGKIDEMNLEYQMREGEKSTTIAFIDVSFNYLYLKNLFFKLFFILIGSFFLFLMLSIYLSRFVVCPVEKAWNQQKQFIADASHELKTPLTVILTNLKIISSHPEYKIQEQKKWLDNTKEEADRMKELLEELLFLAKNDAASLPVVKQEVDFSYLCLSTVLLFESVAYENKVSLSEEIQEGIFFLGDEKQLRQLLVILLDNACKYGRNGSVEVCLEKKQDRIELRVKNEVQVQEDVIAGEEREHIFERFYRIDKSRTRRQKGYGLGLAIADTIVKNHGGRIRVKSSMEEGTEFEVCLPFEKHSSLLSSKVRFDI